MTKNSCIWFSDTNYCDHLTVFRNKNNIHFLEIGSFEGYSANYFVENYLMGSGSTLTCIDPWIKYSEATIENLKGVDNLINSKTYNIFLNNTKEYKNRIIVKRGLSKDILPSLEKKYHFIYIDGDHSEDAVWLDAVLIYEKLVAGGIIIFDDYKWGLDNKEPKNIIDKLIKEFKVKLKVLLKFKSVKKSPKNAIDRFIKSYKNKINVLAINRQVVAQKRDIVL